MAWQSPVTPAVPELLAPAGDWDCAKAAVANGADAIYFGLDTGFNARARATNFSLDTLPDLMTFLHQHGVAGYVTTNILAFSDELKSLEKAIRRIAEAGADAVLVQDLGLVRLIRRTAPDLSIHASTQMSLTSAECINKAQALGVERVVLARELSVDEIARIHEQTTMKLEVFVHGALCVAYSGQCLTSESLGGRSANRGQCAQACRLPYELVCDGRDKDLGEQKYLLSPQDLAAYALIPDLIAAGATAFKIEGRLKTAEYVANITRHYREAIDATKAGHPVSFTPRQVEEMELSFSRGFSAGWLNGCDHKALVPGLSSAKRGVLIGTVLDMRKGRLRIELHRPLKAGDGIVLEGDRAAGEELGGRVYQITQAGRPVQSEVTSGVVEITFHDRAVDLERIWSGQQVWKTDDPALTRRLRKSYTGEIAGRELPLHIAVTAAIGEPLQIRARATGLADVTCVSPEPLAAAIKHPLTAETLEKQLGRLGGTGFVLAELTAEIAGSPMVPLSVLGQLRHDMVAQLTAARDHALHPPRQLSAEVVLPVMRSEITPPPLERTEPELIVLCRSMTQLHTMLEHGQRRLVVDFADIREYGPAVTSARVQGASLYLATPRIQKPGEMGIFHALARHQADGILVRNLAGLEFFTSRDVPCVTDYSLNAANELTVAYLREQGALRITASYDLNRDQLIDMARHSRVDLLEVVIHQHMPMFHMEHCVFCSVLSPGTNKTNCGRPCDIHRVQMRDRVGSLHTLTADVGCRNTLFNGTPQSGAEAVDHLIRLGVRTFRVEFLDEEVPDRLCRCVDLYRDLIAGRITGREVWTTLQAVNRTGVTRGTLEQRRDPLAII
jgi:putative protease